MSFRHLVPGAIYDSNLETLRSLVAAGVCLDEPLDGVTPLCLAARLGRLDVVQFLLDDQKVHTHHTRTHTFTHSRYTRTYTLNHKEQNCFSGQPQEWLPF